MSETIKPSLSDKEEVKPAAASLMDEMSKLIKDYEQSSDPKIQAAVKQLQEIKSELEFQKQVKTPINWVEASKTTMQAAHWIGILYKILSEHWPS